MKNLRKSLIIGVMALTAISMSGLNVSAAAPQAGDLIKMDGLSAVYFLGNDGKRYVYPNSDVFFSWHKDFSGVVTVSASELANYTIGSLIAVRPGTKLVKITTDPKVYAVEANGTLRQIASEADAIAIYGASWAKRVIDVNDSFFAATYTVGTPLTSGSIAAGTLVKNANSAAIYYFDGTNYRSIATEAAFNANRFEFANVVTRSVAIVAGGTAITTGEFSYDAQKGGGTAAAVVTGSGLTASISSATPGAMNVPAGSAVEFLKVNLTAANDGAINVSSLKLTAYGLSDATNINDVTIYDNGVKVGTSKDVNSDREATFNFSTPINVPAGSTKTLTVKATVLLGTTGSHGLGIAAASNIISTGAVVSGSFPIVGSIMSSVSASIGSVTILDTDVTNSVSFGEDNVLLADFTLSTGSTEDALLQSISLYNAGTNDNNIVSNLKLIIDGEEVATGSYADRYATFAINNYEIKKSDSVSVEVRGDIGVTSAGDTIQLYLKNASDMSIIGKTQGFGLTVTNNFIAALTVVTLGTGDFTIDMNKTLAPAMDVKPGTDNVVLANIVMKSNGENATITGIAGSGFYITENSSDVALLENIKLVDTATGGVYDLTVATTGTQIQLTLDDEISLVKGVAKTFELKADILSTVNESDTFTATLTGAALTIEGDVSGADISDITPSSISGSIITVKNASLSFSPTVLNTTSVVGGAKDVVVYQAKVKAGTADAVKITSVKLDVASSTSVGAFTDSNISKLSLWLNGKLLKETSNQINETGNSVTFSSLDPANYTVAAGAEVDLIVKADFTSSIVAGDFTLSIDDDSNISARAVADNDTVVAVIVATTDSRVVTAVSAGTLTVALVTTDAKANRDSMLLAGSQTEVGRYLGEIKFTTVNEAIKVKTLILTEGSSVTSADLSAVKLVTATGTVVATQAVSADGSVTFDPFDVVFDADKTTSLFVVAVAKGLNVSGDPTSTATAGRQAVYTLATTTATGFSSGATTVVTNSVGTSKTATVVGSKLNSVVSAMSNGPLTGGAQILGKYTLTFDNGANRDSASEDLKAVLTNMVVAFSKSAGVEVSTIQLYVDGSTDKVNVTSDTVEDATTSGIATWDSTALLTLVDSAKMDGPVTLVVSGTVTGTTATGEYVQTLLSDLDGTGSVITYSSNAINHTSMYLPVSDVAGAILSE